MHPDEPEEPFGDRARGALTSGRSVATRAYPSPSRPTGANGTAGTVAQRVPRPLDHLSFDAQTWLEARGLDPEVALKMGVVSADVPGGGDWIAFPYRRDGRVVNHKYRRIDGKDFRQDKGAVQCWWNHDVITDPTLADQPLIVTEGELDGLAAMSAGYVRVVSVPGGAPQNPSESNAKYSFVAETLDALRTTREIVLAVDGDGPGAALLHDLAVRLGRGRCKYLTYAPGTKDLNDVLLGYGPAAVTNLIATARWCHVPGLFRMSELPPAPEAAPHSTMIHGLAEHFNVRKGDFSVFTGIPGSGKSTFVNDLCCRMARHHGWSTVFASFEQHPQHDHRRALRTWHAGEPEPGLSRAQIDAADAWIDSHFSFVIPSEDEDSTMEWLLDKFAAAVIRYGVDICVVDPWNEMDHSRSKEQTLTEYVGRAIRDLKKFARTFNVHMIVVAHPTKIMRDKDGKLPMPTLYDISDSAHWFNKPDAGLILHPCHDGETNTDYTALKVAKSRYHDQIGRPGTVRLQYNKWAARFQGID